MFGFVFYEFQVLFEKMCWISELHFPLFSLLKVFIFFIFWLRSEQNKQYTWTVPTLSSCVNIKKSRRLSVLWFIYLWNSRYVELRWSHWRQRFIDLFLNFVVVIAQSMNRSINLCIQRSLCFFFVLFCVSPISMFCVWLPRNFEKT